MEDAGKLFRELAQSAREREEVAAGAREVDIHMGVIARELMHEHAISQREIARVAGISVTHVSTLIRRANDADARGHGPQVEDGVPLLTANGILQEVRQTSARPAAVIAGFDAFDVLMSSRIPPVAFTHNRSIRVPNMLVRFADDQLLGVADVNAGYSGTGPRNARSFIMQLLEELGRSDRADLAEAALKYRFFKLDLLAEDHDFHDHTLFDLRVPERHGASYVGKLDRSQVPGASEEDRRPTAEIRRDGLSTLEAWVALLDTDDLPEWLGGREQRVARVFTSREASWAQGFGEFGRPSLHKPGTYQVILEQGELQLWIPVYPTPDPTRVLSDETYQVLEIAGLLPAADIEAATLQSRLSRYLSRKLGHYQEPQYFDVSDSTAGLSYIPANHDRG